MEKTNSAGVSKEDLFFLDSAIECAEKGSSLVFPNPRVGALYVKEGEVQGEGFHQKCGEAHAEVAAAEGMNSLEGTTLYVSLEPCSHKGKTPPCAEFIIKKGVKRVVYSMPDPGPGAGGAQMLQNAGIEVVGPLFRKKAFRLLEPFCKNMIHHKAYITLKWAMTLDGKIACASGDSRWVTGSVAREHVHRVRTEVDGILVGAGTLCADNPDLGVRHGIEGPVPRPVIWDPRGRTREKREWYLSHKERKPLIVVNSSDLAKDWPQECELLICPSLSELESSLFGCGIHHLLVEGGSGVHGAFNDAGLGDRALMYTAPKIIGGSGALGAVGGKGVERMAEARSLSVMDYLPLGGDMLNEGLFQYYHPRAQEFIS